MSEAFPLGEDFTNNLVTTDVNMETTSAACTLNNK